jgi:hypothetical protein
MTTRDACATAPATTPDEPWPAGRPVLVKALQWTSWRPYVAHQIGKRGLFLRTRDALPVGTVLEMEILHAGHASIQVHGTVHACLTVTESGPTRRPPGWCVSLAALPAATQQRLDAFVDETECQDDLPAVLAAAAAAPPPAAPSSLRPSGLFTDLVAGDAGAAAGAAPLDPTKFKRRSAV